VKVGGDLPASDPDHVALGQLYDALFEPGLASDPVAMEAALSRLACKVVSVYRTRINPAYSGPSSPPGVVLPGLLTERSTTAAQTGTQSNDPAPKVRHSMPAPAPAARSEQPAVFLELRKWVAALSIPRDLRLRPGVIIRDPERFRTAILADLEAGTRGARWRTGAVQADLRGLELATGTRAPWGGGDVEA